MLKRVGRDTSQSDRILIVPVPGGWLSCATFNLGPLAFRSGAEAERDARAVAVRLACAGRGVNILIFDRAGALIVNALYPAVGGAVVTGFEVDQAPPP